MRVVRVGQIDWTGKPYQVCDVVYAGSAYGAAVVTDEGIAGIGAGPGIDKFVEGLEALIDGAENLGRSLMIAEQERARMAQELLAFREEVARRPAPTAGFTITELSDAIVKVVNAVKA